MMTLKAIVKVFITRERDAIRLNISAEPLANIKKVLIITWKNYNIITKTK